MRNLKKILALVVVFALAISMMANAVSFTDLASTKTGDANKINFVSTLGIVKGYASADGKTFEFRQDGKITRAEISTIIYRLLTGDVANATFKAKTNFPDVTEGDWFGGYVKYATALEPSVILGRTNGNFDPKADVTIAEAATMLVRALGYDKMTSLEAGVAKACELGIIATANGADAAATRGQIADMVYNAMFNKYLRNTTTAANGGSVNYTLAYSIFKIAPFDAVVTASGSGKVDLAVTENFNGYVFSDNFFDWLMGAGNGLVGQPNIVNHSGVAYTGMDSYVGYAVRMFAKDLNGNGKYDIYDGVSFMYVSPKNVVKEGTMKDFGSQSNSNDRAENQKFAFVKGESNVYGYETTPANNEPIRVYENNRLIADKWVGTVYSDSAKFVTDFGTPTWDHDSNANTPEVPMPIEAYYEQFMESSAYATYKMIDNDGDGKYEFAWTTFTGNAKLGDITSTGLVRFEDIDNTLETRVDWARVFPKFVSKYDSTTNIKATDVTLGNTAAGDYVYITPNWDGSKYTYTLDKAETVTGKLTSISFGGADKITLDGKTYTMANTLYLYNYPGYEAAGGFYQLGSTNNLGKYFRLVMGKSGNVWRVEKYTPAATLSKGHYGVITDVATTPVNLKASDPFATPVWTVQIKMTNENGESKVYNTTVTQAAGNLYNLLTARKNVSFVKYALNADGYVVVADAVYNANNVLVTPATPVVNASWNANELAAQNTVFDYNPTTKYFTKEGFSTANGDLKYKVDDYTTIFMFNDNNDNNLKDANETFTVIKAADLAAQNNVRVYADETSVVNSIGIKYLNAIVLMTKNNLESGYSIHMGWWTQSETKTIDADGNPTSWTYSFVEHNGTKSYTSVANIANAWGFASYKVYMFAVNADGVIVKFYPYVTNKGTAEAPNNIYDYDRAPSEISEGVYFNVNVLDSARNDADMDVRMTIDVKNTEYPGQLMTTLTNAIMNDDTKVYILKSTKNGEGKYVLGEGQYIDPAVGPDVINWSSWTKANGSSLDPYFDFNKWTGKYNDGDPMTTDIYDLTATETAMFNADGKYYKSGWAKFNIENGQLYITELYLVPNALGATAIVID